MKNKPLRHKQYNTFKFLPFSDRIANIHVDVFHRVGHRYEDAANDDEVLHSDTKFFAVLLKWNRLNKSESYRLLKDEINPDNVRTLPLLVLFKKHVVDVLLKHLTLENDLSLQALLELIAALAQDLLHEFYNFYPEFHTKLIGLLNTKDADRLEWTFTCLAYLFKYLWRYIIKDITAVFESLVPLLSSSKPQYVNNFAADSFAFIVRKVKDRRNFLKLILRSIQTTKDGISGCGRLLCATVTGISDQFHSCAEPLLLSLFQALSDESLPKKLLFQVLDSMVGHLTSSISAKHSEVFWKTAIAVAKEFSKSQEETSNDQTEGLCFVLQLMKKALGRRQALWLTDPPVLVTCLVNLIQNGDEKVLVEIVENASILLLSTKIHLSQEHCSLLINKVLSESKQNIVKLFFERTIQFSGFNLLIQPRMIEFCEKEHPCKTLDLMTKLILNKAPLSHDGVDNLRYVLNFRPLSVEGESFSSLLLNEIPSDGDVLLNNTEQIVRILIVLPHLEPIDEHTAIERLQALLKTICDLLEMYDIQEKSGNILRLLFVLLSTLRCIIQIKKIKNIQNLILPDVANALIRFGKVYPYHSLALRCLNLCLDNVEASYRAEISTKVWDDLVLGLSSAYHQVRLQTAQLLLRLLRSTNEEQQADEETERCLEAIIEAENIESTIYDYRAKLKALQKIECCQAVADCKFPTIPLNYLLGVLYVNFKLLWDPVCKLITSYAIQLPQPAFWNVFNARLKEAKYQIKDNNEVLLNFESEFEMAELTEFFKKINAMDDKPDHWNYRNLIWKNMSDFAHLCERKNRDIVPLFLTFLEEEYFRANATVASKWNIKLTNKVGLEEAMEVDDDEEEEVKNGLNGNGIEDDTSEDRKVESLNESSTELENSSIPGKSATKALLAHMSVFSKFKDPGSMYREPEMRKIYFELLTHKNPEVQKNALDCIMTYKDKFIVPYRDHLYGLIDDKTFKDEITLFRIDTESDMVKPEHRPNLMPVVMRILYSKMLNKSGVRTGSKSLGQLRRSLVLRFLAGCETEELMMYFQMAFRMYTPYVKDSPEETIQYVKSVLDFGSMVPPRRLQSSVNLLSVVLIQCGGLMSNPVLSYLMKVLLCIGQMACSALQDREVIHPGYIAPLRAVRNSAIDVVSRYFESFENYPWSSNELDAVFEVFVWPWLAKLPIEGIHSPTSLFKLFSVWSKNQRYFPLLGKRNESEQPDALTAVMELFSGAKTHNSVCNGVFEIVERLLTLQDLDERMEDVEASTTDMDISLKQIQTTNLPVFNSETVPKISELDNLNYGSLLLLPHVPTILEKIRFKLLKKGLKCHLGQRDLTILSRATELVKDPETSETLVSLLLPVLVKKAKSSEDIVCPLLTTVSNLIKNIDDAAHYVQQLAPMFGLVSSSEARKMLTQITASIGRDCDVDEQLLDDLNAWDQRWLDQPDFIRRLDAFKRIRTMVDAKEMPIDMGIIIIHTCFHFLKTEKDMSLRDSASQCIRNLCPALCQMHKRSRDLLIEQTILKIIASAIRDKKNELIQQEATGLLGCMARECSELHPVLNDLSILTTKTDLEVDFFENLLHLQLHRRGRALLKLSEVLKNVKKLPMTRTITQFLLPMISQFLCAEKYGNKNSLIDSAVEALGTICRLLPWHQYELILRYYLGKLRRNIDFQKQLVKIVVAILNAFHFDLSKATELQDVKVEIKGGTSDETKIKADSEENSEERNDDSGKKKATKTGEKEEEEGEESDNEDTDENEQEEKDLDANLDMDEEEIIQEDLQVTEEKCAADKITVLSRAGANRVIHTIKNGLLLQLHKTIAMRTQSDLFHKLNRKQLGPDKDEEDILRIPIALAAVKLLQRLPVEFLEQNLPGILMKLCTFLKSRLDSVRRVTRETMQKVMIALGPKYLPVLITEMTQLLTRGFHVHVLIYSLHSVLVSIKNHLEPGSMDVCVPMILEVCKLDLFGNAAEEKEVAQIAGKLLEARSNRSYNMFHIMGEFVTEKCLINLVLPLKEELSNTLSYSVVHKVNECLQQLVLGLVDNRFVSTESILIFSYGVTSESIPSLAPPSGSSKEVTIKEKELAARQKPDSYLLPEDPKGRPKVETKRCAKTNSHVLVEFGLRLIHFMLKRDKIKGEDYRPLLDPLVPVIQSCLDSQHVKITTSSLKCFCWLLKKDLPSLKTSIKKITEVLFSILHRYAAAGLSKGDNFDLVMVAFKAVAVIVRDVKYYELSENHLKALLLYCEQDIHDPSRQATAFSLLKAIVGRKLNCPELHEVISKLEELSMTSLSDNVRLQARQIVHLFLTEYKLGKKFPKHLYFYVVNLEYNLQSGRESGLDFLQMLIKSMTKERLDKYDGYLFLHICSRLVNEEVAAVCRKAEEVVLSLVSRMDKSRVDSLYDELILVWLTKKQIPQRKLGFHACRIISSVEKENFQLRLPSLLKVILQRLSEADADRPGKFVRLNPKPNYRETEVDDEEEEIEGQAITFYDGYVYQLMNMLYTIATSCSVLVNSQTFTEDVETICVHAVNFLGHPHEWVRNRSAQFLGAVISSLNPEEIAAIANRTKEETVGYLKNETRINLKLFAKNHLDQLIPDETLDEQFLEQYVKNLIFVAEVAKDIQYNPDEELMSLSWLIREMRKAVHTEIVQSPSSTIVRRMVFKWMAALVKKFDRDTLKSVLHKIMSPLVRELNMADDENPNQTKLKQIAKETCVLIRKKFGSEEYNRLVTNHTKLLDVRRAERKKEKAQLVVREPEIAAKRKIMKQQKKKEHKKRKIDALKGRKPKRKTKGKDINLDDA